MIRTFVAIDLPEDVQRSIAEFQNCLKQTGASLTWVRPDRIHLTLKFLGNVSQEQLLPIGQKLTQIAVGVSPFSLQPWSCGAFPSLRQMRVVWVGLKGDEGALKHLHTQVEAAMAELGFQREDRPFRAHLTLARVRGKMQLRALQEALTAHRDFHAEAFDVSELVLYKSDLKPEGAVYTPLLRAPFSPE